VRQKTFGDLNFAANLINCYIYRMITTRKQKKKNYNRVVGFRLDEVLAPKFEAYIEALNIADSELIRTAFRHGFEGAIKEIEAVKIRQADELRSRLAKLRGGWFEPPLPIMSRCARRRMNPGPGMDLFHGWT
jgi:hypothetical protein